LTDTVPVRVPARDVEGGARRSRIRPETVSGCRASCGIPLLPVHDFVVGVIELDVAREMAALCADIGNLAQIPSSQLWLHRRSARRVGKGRGIARSRRSLARWV